MIFLLIYHIYLFHFPFVTSFILPMDGTKSTGLDRIWTQSINMVPIVLSFSLTFIINKRNTSGIFRSVWNYLKVKPLFKSRAKDELNNYRPISILPTLSKIIEKWTYMRLM